MDPSAALGTSTTGDRGVLLRDAVDRARRSAFYACHLAGHELRSEQDLGALPLTFKEHLREASPFGMLAVPPARAWHYHETTGTTGAPVSTWWGTREMRAMAEMLHQMVPELADDNLLLNRLPLFAPAAFVFEEAARMGGWCHVAAGNLTWDVPFERALDFIRRLRVTALACLPFEPILLREIAREKDLDPARELDSLRVIFCGGAVLPPSLRRILEQDWGARVVEIYGSNETMGLGVSCTQGRLHLCTHFVHVELLDPRTHAPVPPGQPGVLTVTSLIHEVMPLVRYVTGDLVRIHPDPCPCGLALPTADVLGRVDETIEIGAARVTHYEVLDAVYDAAARVGTRIFFVIVLHRGLHVLFEVGNSVRGELEGIARELSKRLGLPVSVEGRGHNDVLDRAALMRGPKIYKPSLISDWRTQTRKTITIMEAILEWPRFDFRTVVALVRREIRNRRRRARLLKEDTKPLAVGDGSGPGGRR